MTESLKAYIFFHSLRGCWWNYGTRQTACSSLGEMIGALGIKNSSWWPGLEPECYPKIPSDMYRPSILVNHGVLLVSNGPFKGGSFRNIPQSLPQTRFHLPVPPIFHVEFFQADVHFVGSRSAVMFNGWKFGRLILRPRRGWCCFCFVFCPTCL